MNNPMIDPMEKLLIADPEIAHRVQTALQCKKRKGDFQAAAIMADEIIWALSRETTFGKAVAMGFAGLLGDTDTAGIRKYAQIVHGAGVQGPAIGRLMATYLVPIIRQGRGALLEQFLVTVEIMMGKGVYTLKDPLDVLAGLLGEGDQKGATAFLDLLQDTFGQPLTYNRSMHFTCILPRAVHALSPLQRAWQVRQLARIIRTDLHLVEPFIDGLAKGLTLLHEKALEQFVSAGLQEFEQKPDAGIRFLSLASNQGMERFQDLQVTVGLAMLCFDLNCYLCARTGQGLIVRSITSLPLKMRMDGNRPISVFSDATAIYLPDTIGHYPEKSQNEALYKCLTRVEAGLHEFGTFDFDLEKLGERWPRDSDCFPDFEESCRVPAQKQALSDLERFFALFPEPKLARDLFTIFEHGRIRLCLTRRYPGLVKNAAPLFRTQALQMAKKNDPSVLFGLYIAVALAISPDTWVNVDAAQQSAIRKISGLFRHRMGKDPVVETSAELAAVVYDRMAAMVACHRCRYHIGDGYLCLQTPFGCCIRPDLYFAANRPSENMACAIKALLAEKNIRVYKSDIRRTLVEKGGALDLEDIKKLVLSARRFSEPALALQKGASPDLSRLDLDSFLRQRGIEDPATDNTLGTVFRYQEWDCTINDYLSDHTRVLEKNIRGIKNDFYTHTLQRCQGLVRQIRHVFELLKPEGLVLLRPWLEGDEFDYHSLLDFAIAKKTGRMPEERLYSKRIKQHRDVAVLLLVDLSRSTANCVCASGSDRPVRVLDIEKEAIVLFCEALAVVGDRFSIAGFSGTGRLGVDYFKIKDFDEAMEEGVQQRINAMAPQRSTRMGAAIRHATTRLAKVPAKVRLLIILGDGFPNDNGYKREYAITDTRKAVFEAHSKQIFTHAITVNMTRDTKLDAIYGEMSHNVISNVCELPSRLLRIYSALTRQ
jgi:fructose-specific component phosphotransferase system IIB-like protein